MTIEPSNSERQQGGPHTVADVENAIGALGEVGWRRLRTAARDSIGVDDPVADPEELLNEALMRLLDGRRTWRREVGFEYQLARVMDSIASDWGRREAPSPVVSEHRLYSSDEAEDEDAPSPMPEAVTPEPSAEDSLLGARRERQIANLFMDDPRALQVLECMSAGLSRREMRQRTRMSEKQLEAAVRRVRRRVRAASSAPAAAAGAESGDDSEVTEQVTPQVGRLLSVMEGELSRAELMARLGLEHRVHFTEVYLRPALEAGWIEMTIPDKPNSSLQKYRRIGERAARGTWTAPPPTEQVTPQVEELLGVMEGEQTRAELMARLGLKDRTHFGKAYLRPALEADLIEMTIPEKPRSRSQRYRRFAKGAAAVGRKGV
ncbi:MAG: hypothetical protein GY719_14040 [bacterium]|nr:hypothetical protein [bacterium]